MPTDMIFIKNTLFQIGMCQWSVEFVGYERWVEIGKNRKLDHFSRAFAVPGNDMQRQQIYLLRSGMMEKLDG